MLAQVKSSYAQYDNYGKLYSKYISTNDYLTESIADSIKLYTYNNSNINEVILSLACNFIQKQRLLRT